MGTTWHSDAATAVALRVPCSISAISPKILPFSTTSSKTPPRRSSTWPLLTTYMNMPGSFSRKIVSPGLYDLKLSAYFRKVRLVFSLLMASPGSREERRDYTTAFRAHVKSIRYEYNASAVELDAHTLRGGR